MQKEVLGEKHANTVNSKTRIASYFYEKQQFHNAEEMFREVKDMREKVFRREAYRYINFE